MIATAMAATATLLHGPLLLHGLAPLLAEEHGDGKFNPFEWAPGATIWTWVIFLIALPLMWKFVFGPITSGLDARDRRVEDAIAAAERARADAEGQINAARAELEQARAEARKTVQEAITQAQRQGQEALQQAQAEADRQLRKAREDIDAEKRKALMEIRQEVVELAIGAARTILHKEVDEPTNRRMVEDFLGGVRSRSN